MHTTEELLAAFDDQLRTAAQARDADGVRAERDGPLLRLVGERRGLVLLATPRSGLAGADLDALIGRQRDYFAARGEPVEWKTFGHDQPADLPGRLTAAGFTADPAETVVVAPTAVAAVAAAVPVGVRLREATDADLPAVADLQTAVWGEDHGWLTADLRRRKAAAGDRLRILVADAGGAVVAAGWLVVTPGVDFAGLWGGCTLPRWRGRGVYRALVAARARRAAAAGVPYVQVDASAASRPILHRLGFTTLTTTTPYLWRPA